MGCAICPCKWYDACLLNVLRDLKSAYASPGIGTQLKLADQILAEDKHKPLYKVSRSVRCLQFKYLKSAETSFNYVAAALANRLAATRASQQAAAAMHAVAVVTQAAMRNVCLLSCRFGP